MKRIKDSKKIGLVMAFDISGAFDKINWAEIVNNAKELGANKNYINLINLLLTERTIEWTHNNIKYERKVKQGCPQGRMASPDLWIIGMNKLLMESQKTGQQHH